MNSFGILLLPSFMPRAVPAGGSCSGVKYETYERSQKGLLHGSKEEPTPGAALLVMVFSPSTCFGRPW